MIDAPSRRPLRILAAAALLAGCGPGAPPAAAPAPDADAVVRAVLISDLNDAYGTVGYSAPVHAVVDRIVREWRPDVVIAAGDLVAGQRPTLSDSTVREMWSAFDSLVARPLRDAGIPLVAALGNHDASAYPAHERDRRLAMEHWTTAAGPPSGAVEAADFPLRYTVRIGDVFFAAWDATRQESSVDSADLEWLEAALRSSEARTARHRVVVGHLPLYPVAVGRERAGEFLLSGDSLRRELEALGVTLFVSGHHHAYYPGRRGDLPLLHAGALGGGPRPLLGGTDARRAVALLELGPEGVRISAYEVRDDGGFEPIDTGSLPRVLCSSEAYVVRRDLADRGRECPAAPEEAAQ